MSSGTEPRFKDKETRVKEIQRAAKKLFFKKGYQNVTIDEIAKMAKISKGTVYLYFKNKEDLYISLMIPVTEELGRKLLRLEENLASGSFKNCRVFFEELIDVYYSIYQSDPEGLKIIQAFQQGALFPGLSDETREKLNSLGKRNFLTARTTFLRAKEIGLFKAEVDEIILADVFWGTFIGIVQLEESKLRATKKDHLYDTLRYTFLLIEQAVCQ